MVEIITNGVKWLLFNVYKQPTVTNAHFKTCMENILTRCTAEGVNFVICGDMNVNMLQPNNCLSNIFDVYGVKNVIKSATCFKGKVPTMIDLVITNVSKSLKDVKCIECDLSDFHKMVCFSTKLKVPVKKKRHIMYRSYKRFDEDAYVNDLSNVPYHVCDIFDDVDDAYWFYETLTKQVIEEHAPLKKKVIKNNQAPYMNGPLRKAINVKNMFRRKFYKCKSSANWEIYRQHRNNVTEQRRSCMKEYVRNTCAKSNGGKEFWRCIKPLISNKNITKNSDIILTENDNVINKQEDVSNLINDYYVNVTKTIGYEDSICLGNTFGDIVSSHTNNNSVLYIKDNIATGGSKFRFKNVETAYMFDILKKINTKKATGFDNIPPKLLKYGAHILCNPITRIINKCIDVNEFPDVLKRAEVPPIFKKGDIMNKANYRPVSVLPCISKIFEYVLIDQMKVFLEPMLSPHLSGFRKGHSCQNVLLRLVENCKYNLDKGGISGVLLTDLSKAFDCLSYRLIISKLSAYGFDENACMMMANYFTNRQQRVKIGDARSQWLNIQRGAPQGSLMGTFIYNILTNDMLYMINDLCEIYNYADDNSICFHGRNVNDIVTNIESVSNVMFTWFKENNLKANPDKCQFILFTKDVLQSTVNINNITLHSLASVKLLGVHIDRELNFNCHVTEVCRRAGRQLNALGRLANVLDMKDMKDHFV